MSFYELKEIPITDLLTHLGHRPVSRAKGGRQWFYHSPLREDNNASFCVSSDKNLWYDFGTSRGGNVIDLARALNGDGGSSKALPLRHPWSATVLCVRTRRWRISRSFP